jgi:hypothetical protein
MGLVTCLSLSFVCYPLHREQEKIGGDAMQRGRLNDPGEEEKSVVSWTETADQREGERAGLIFWGLPRVARAGGIG